MEAVRTELVEREKIREEIHSVQVWLEATEGLLAEMEQSSITVELQVGGTILNTFCQMFLKSKQSNDEIDHYERIHQLEDSVRSLS